MRNGGGLRTGGLKTVDAPKVTCYVRSVSFRVKSEMFERIVGPAVIEQKLGMYENK